MRFAVPLILVFSVAACASPPAPIAPPADTSSALPAATADTCGASMYGELIGKPIDGSGVPGQGKFNRHILPGTQVTMDYVAQRMNIEANDKGVITRINCG